MPLTAKFGFEAIGTAWQIETKEPLTSVVIGKIHAVTESYDKTYSRFRADSLVHTIKSKQGTYTFPESAIKLFDLYDKLYAATGGLVTPLIGDTLEDAGYDADYSLRRKNVVRPAEEWDKIVLRDQREVTVSQPVTIDVGAAGKGYLADIVAEELRTAGISESIIDASGDIVHCSDVADTIGLEDPRDASRILGTVKLSNGSLCASAPNRRKWQDMHHIINPHTTKPVTDIIATWVIADDGLTADGLSTALFFVGPQALKAFTFSYACLYKDGSMQYDQAGDWQIFS